MPLNQALGSDSPASESAPALLDPKAKETAFAAGTYDAGAADKAQHAVWLATNAFGATGVKRVARAAATQALLDEGFGSVEEARSALTTLGSQIWCAAVLEGMRSKNPTIRRTAMQSFERAARIGGQDGALIQTFVLQFGLGSLEDVRAVLDQARAARENPPEQTDRDCIEWLEARGYRVLRSSKALPEQRGGA